MGRYAKSVLFMAMILLLAAPLRAQWAPDGVGVCIDPGNQGGSHIAPDDHGGATIAWADERGVNPGIYAQRLDPYGNAIWPANGVVVATSSGYHYNPMVISDGFAGAIILWVDERPVTPGLYVQRLDFDGNPMWTANGVHVTSTIFGDPRMVSDGAGGAIIVWDDAWPGNVLVRGIDGDGNLLMGPTALSSTGYGPRITTDGAGGAIVTWMDDRGANTDIYAQKCDNNGATFWTVGGVLISSAGYYDWWPRITYDLFGGAIITWWHANGTIAQRIDAFGNTLWTAGGITVASAGTDSDPQIVPDGSGGAVIVYNFSNRILAQRVDMWGTIMWASYGMFVGTGTLERRADQVVADGLGGAIVTWEYGPSSSENIYAQRIDGSGNALWATGGEHICTAPFDQKYPRITTDALGGAIIAWVDARSNSSYDIYAQRVVRSGFWGYPAPTIVAVEDVPGDQGGMVNVAWNASHADAWPDQAVAGYSVWRAIDLEGVPFIEEGAMMITSAEDLPPNPEHRVILKQMVLEEPYYWDYIAWLDAFSYATYSKAVPTLFDSTALCSDMHYFQVTAHKADGEVWTSPPDSGYSVDNLGPCPPMCLAGEQSFVPEGLTLTWAPNTDVDLDGYRVYRGLSEDFIPDPGNLVAEPCDTILFDGDWRWDNDFYYKVSAMDIHGNESPFALLRPVDITGEETPDVKIAYFLDQNMPNPFNPMTTIRYGLKEPGNVNLRIYDAAGRLVRVLVSAHRGAGPHEVVWDGQTHSGRQAASGVYFYKLLSGRFSETRKMILLR